MGDPRVYNMLRVEISKVRYYMGDRSLRDLMALSLF